MPTRKVTVADLKDKVGQALGRREKLIQGFEHSKVDAYRLFCGPREGIAGLEVDRFGPLLVFYLFEGRQSLQQAELLEFAEIVAEIGRGGLVTAGIFQVESAQTVDNNGEMGRFVDDRQ